MPKFNSEAARQSYIERRQAARAKKLGLPVPAARVVAPGGAQGVELGAIDAALEAIEQKLVALADLKRQLLHTRELLR